MTKQQHFLKGQYTQKCVKKIYFKKYNTRFVRKMWANDVGKLISGTTATSICEMNVCHFHDHLFLSLSHGYELSVWCIITVEMTPAAWYKSKPQDYQHHLLLRTNDRFFPWHYKPYINHDRFAVASNQRPGLFIIFREDILKNVGNGGTHSLLLCRKSKCVAIVRLLTLLTINAL